MSIERRLKLLEQAGGGECSRCSGVFVVIVSGQFCRATRHGEPMSEEEYQQYEREKGPDGECPDCDQIAGTIKVGGPARSPSRIRLRDGR